MPARDRPLYAVLIDADNVPAKHAEAILREINGFAEPGLRRVYGDWSNPHLGPWKERARALGLVEHQEASNTKGKNASDIGLVIDAMDILHSGRFDGFVLVSSDSDFTRLAIRIREQGLDVVGVGEDKTPDALKNAVNRFILLENITDEPVEGARGKQAAGKRPPREALELVLSAMQKIETEDDWYPLSQIGQQIVADKKDFDPRSYGQKKLSDLIVQLRRFETKREGNHLFIRRTD